MQQFLAANHNVQAAPHCRPRSESQIFFFFFFFFKASFIRKVQVLSWQSNLSMKEFLSYSKGYCLKAHFPGKWNFICGLLCLWFLKPQIQFPYFDRYIEHIYSKCLIFQIAFNALCPMRVNNGHSFWLSYIIFRARYCAGHMRMPNHCIWHKSC